MKPLIKWVGGKRRFISKISPYIKDFNVMENTYFEPFAGSAALFFSIEPSNSYINDLNGDLINFYEIVKKEPKNLHDLINKIFDDKNLDYYNVRRDYNKSKKKKMKLNIPI